MNRGTALVLALSFAMIAGLVRTGSADQATVQNGNRPSAQLGDKDKKKTEAKQAESATPAPTQPDADDLRNNKKIPVRKDKLTGFLSLSTNLPCAQPSCIIQVDTHRVNDFGPPPNTREIPMDPGTHAIVVVVKGEQTMDQSFEIRTADRSRLSISVPMSDAAPPTGTLTVHVDRASKVRVGDTAYDIKSDQRITLPFGDHVVQLQSTPESKPVTVTLSSDSPSVVVVLSHPAPTATPAPPPPAPIGGEIEWVPVIGGTMMLGCVTGDTQCQPDERPRRVDIASFRMMSTEVTYGQFEQWLKGKNALKEYERPDWSVSIPVAELPLHPAVRVKWAEARAFCQDHSARLPREDEWEFAARQNRRDAIYAWDPEWDVYMTPPARRASTPPPNGRKPPANIADESGFAVNPTWRAYAVGYDDHYPYTAPVAKTQPIKGIYDLIGNVWEWMDDDYIGKPGRKVVRGGSFSSQPAALRVSFRGSYDEREQREDVGFRCVR